MPNDRLTGFEYESFCTRCEQCTVHRFGACQRCTVDFPRPAVTVGTDGTIPVEPARRIVDRKVGGR